MHNNSSATTTATVIVMVESNKPTVVWVGPLGQLSIQLAQLWASLQEVGARSRWDPRSSSSSQVGSSGRKRTLVILLGIFSQTTRIIATTTTVTVASRQQRVGYRGREIQGSTSRLAHAILRTHGEFSLSLSLCVFLILHLLSLFNTFVCSRQTNRLAQWLILSRLFPISCQRQPTLEAWSSYISSFLYESRRRGGDDDDDDGDSHIHTHKHMI